MASVLAETTTRAPVVVHRLWWRGRLVQVAAIVALMYVAYRAWALEYPWPNKLVWNSLSLHLDDFQTWLLTERGKEDQSIVFTVFEGFSSGIDHLVEWFNRLLIWATWAGTTVAGVALVLRFGGLRAGLIYAVAFATFALFGLWEESMETLALMLAGRRPLPPRRNPARNSRRPLCAGSAGRSRRSSMRCRSSPRSRT